MTNIVAEKTVTGSWLEALGYTLHFRASTWTEVIVSNAQEQWWGRGPTADGALTHALQGMFPSHASRVLLGTVELRSSTPQAPLEPVPPYASGPGEQEPEPPASSLVLAETPPAVDPVGDEPRQLDLPAAEPPLPTVRLSGGDNVEAEAVELLQRIQRMQAELAICCAEMQRVVLVEWISAARKLEARAGSAPPDALQQVRKIIGRVSARWWPGTMPVLQRRAGLAEARRQLVELGLGEVEQPTDWAHAERIAVQMRERVEAHLAQRGLEPSGYRKSDGPRPAVESANTRLAWVVKQLGALKHVEADAPKFERVALTLRWIRTQVDDPLEWADAWGELREANHKNPKEKWLKQALRWLDPTLVPPKGFASALGIDPDARARGRKRKDLAGRIAALPTDDSGAVATWLAEALPVFSNEELRPLLWKHQQALMAIPEEQLHGRNERRRLRKLREPVSSPAADTSPAATQVDLFDEDATALEHDDGTPLPGEASVRAAMTGKRCVLVTNRSEQGLARDLQARTGMDVAVCENKSRLLDGLVGSIKAGRVAIVMLATSFMGHDVDAKIQEACRSSGGATRMLRVRKGKLRVLMEALEKHVSNGVSLLH